MIDSQLVLIIIDCVMEIIFDPSQVKCTLTKFVYYSGFIESIYHSLCIFYSHWQNNKNRNDWQKHFGL